MSIIAYNHGVAGMRRAVRQMGTDDIVIIVRNYNGRAFGFASRNFYVAFLAAIEVEQNATRFFGPQKKLSPRKDRVVVLPDYVPVDTLEKTFGVSRRTLKTYNPSLKAPVWSGSKYVPSGFKLRLPGDTINSSPSLLLASIPSSQRFDAQTPDLYHKVRRGDTLSLIASRYRTSVTELFGMNSLKSRHRIRVGQVLRFPYSGNASGPALVAARTSVVPGGNTLGERTGRMIIENIGTGNIGTETKETTELVTQDTVQRTVQRSEETALHADPSDYLVASDDTIEVQAAETLGHYADWLEIRTQRLRDLNGYTFRQPLVIGRRLSLKFDRIDRDAFSVRRIAYHRELQKIFFNRYRITGKTIHRLRKGDSIWHLSQRRYKVPVWLMRQYNPDLNLDRVMPGMEIVFPRIEVVDAGSKGDSVATNNQSAPPSLLRHFYSASW